MSFSGTRVYMNSNIQTEDFKEQLKSYLKNNETSKETVIIIKLLVDLYKKEDIREQLSLLRELLYKQNGLSYDKSPALDCILRDRYKALQHQLREEQGTEMSPMKIKL